MSVTGVCYPVFNLKSSSDLHALKELLAKEHGSTIKAERELNGIISDFEDELGNKFSTAKVVNFVYTETDTGAFTVTETQSVKPGYVFTYTSYGFAAFGINIYSDVDGKFYCNSEDLVYNNEKEVDSIY